MHGQWDWMNDPQINSSTWDWDSASTPAAWKHSHNYVHHTYTNIRGKDKDLGYEIMRIDPYQKWYPIYLLQPLYNLVLAAFFEWGVAFHDLDMEALRTCSKPMKQLKRELKGMASRRGARSSRTTSPSRCSAPPRRRPPPCARARAGSRLRKRADTPSGRRWRRTFRQRTAQRVGLHDHLLRPLPRPDVHLQRGGGRGRDARRLLRPPAARRGEHRREPALPRHQRQPRLPGRAPPLPRHAEHARYGEIAPRVKAICEKYELPYNTGPLFKQLATVQRTILRLAFPGGKPRPKPGPYRGEIVA